MLFSLRNLWVKIRNKGWVLNIVDEGTLLKGEGLLWELLLYPNIRR